MIAAVVWKEYREQRLAWAALAVVGAATLFGLPLILAPERPEHIRDWVAWAIIGVAWAYGLICGAMLLAGEREMGTLPFLDGLPGLRGQLWRAKCLAGVLLVIAQVVVLMGLYVVARLFDGWAYAATVLIGMSGAALFGLAWGMLFSALGRSVLNMILLAMGGQAAAALFLVVPAAMLSAAAAAILGLPGPADIGLSWSATVALSIPVALGASALVFTRLDRGRLRPPAPVQTGRVGGPWSRLFWLTARQSKRFAVGLGVFSLLLGFLTLVDGVVVWPAATLLIGVLCGASAFADEQQGPVHFLGDQRFPLGKFWIVKVGVRFLLAVAAVVIVLLPSLIRGLAGPPPGATTLAYYFWARVFHSTLLALYGPPELFVTLWVVCGFCSGCLFGLLLRNGLASGLFALGSALLLAGVWVPSMLGGGLCFWQAFGPPLLLLAATPLLLRPWAAGRIVSWTVAVRLTPFLLLTAAWTAFGLWRRVEDIPVVAPKYDLALAALRARLPKDNENRAGDRVRAACTRFTDLWAKLDGRAPPSVNVSGGPQLDSPHMVLLYGALEHGWRAGDAALDNALNQLYSDARPVPMLGAGTAGLLASGQGQGPLAAAAALVPTTIHEWRSQLAEAADSPTGMVDDLRLLTVADLDRPSAMQAATSMAVVLAAHGLQQQAHGDDAAFLEDLRVGLSLSRNLRHFAPRHNTALGKAVEDSLLLGMDRWLDRRNIRADLLKQALAILSKHREEAEKEDGDRVLVDYLIARNTLDYPVGWLTDDLFPMGGRGESDDRARAEAMLIVQARLTPWEHARQERMVRVLFEGDRIQQQSLHGFGDSEAMLGSIWSLAPAGNYPEPNGFLLCRPAAIQLTLALLLFQEDKGRPAENLEELVPNYLPKLPDDPYNKGQPFHYRVSKGEKIGWPPDVPGSPPQAGEGVLWSVGLDGNDDHGVQQARPDGVTSSGEDVIFRVPGPQKR